VIFHHSRRWSVAAPAAEVFDRPLRIESDLSLANNRVLEAAFIVTVCTSALTPLIYSPVLVAMRHRSSANTIPKLVQQQQEQLEHQQQELEQLQANQNQNYTPGVASSARGGCDKEVEMTATHRGGDKFAAGEFNKALGYYQDALLACPNDERAQVNVARSYEALGNKVAAINLYRKVADSNSATVSDAQEEAKAALLRLQAARMP
jgi:tetratricopeptide (TPR) repeat protein